MRGTAGSNWFAAFVVAMAAFVMLEMPCPAAGDDADDVKSQVNRLIGADTAAASAAGDALVTMGTKSVAPLVAALESSPVAARVAVLETLGRIAADHDEAVEPLVASLVQPDAEVRAAAARGLLAAGPRAKGRAPALTPLLADRFIQVRLAAAAALLRCAGPDPAAFARLSAGFTDKDATARAASIQLLARTGLPSEKTVPPVLVAAKDPSASVRLVAIQSLPVLATIAPHRELAIAQLAASVLDASRDCAVAAIRALVALGAKDSPPAIDAVGRAANSTDTVLRQEALAAIPKLTDEPIAEVTHAGGAFRGDRVRRRGLAAAGGTKATENSVAMALDWLARHQSNNGGWSSAKFDTQCKLNRCAGAGHEGYDAGVTGLALLAFLGAGEMHQRGRYKDVVAHALAYLRGIQEKDGCFGEREVAGFTYAHAIATLAVSEAYMLTADPEIAELAQAGLDFAHSVKGADGWRYADANPTASDTSVTGWMAYALAVGRAARLRVEAKDLDGALLWIERMTDLESGRTGYMGRGGLPNRSDEVMDKFPPQKSESCTAIGLAVRLFCGQSPAGFLVIGKGASLLVTPQHLPAWSTSGGTTDMYYWFWGTLALRQLGGDNWKRWNEAMTRALVGYQCIGAGRDEYGSWDPIDPWSVEGGRVYSTAMCCLCLESYYRVDGLLDAK